MKVHRFDPVALAARLLVDGPDFPGETFRVLKEGEMRHLGEYRTRRLVLEAWDRLGLEPRNRDGHYDAGPAGPDVLLNDLKAELSQAYVRAIARAAGFFVQEAARHLDSDGVDLTMFARSATGTVRSPRLDLQLKATADVIRSDPFPCDLAIQNYDQLRSDDWQIPRILVVVVVPRDATRWVSATDKHLILRRCAYWVSLRGRPASANTATVRVQLSQSSYFHVDQVAAIMRRVQDGGLP